MVRKDRVIALARELVRIDSQNPAGDEAAIAGRVKAFLDAYNIPAIVREYKDRRSNVIAYIGKASARPSLLITPHLDTVPAGKSWSVDPFGAVIRSGRLYGLGATDCKCNLACALEAMASIVEDKYSLAYTLIFAATADEESGSDLGLIPLLKDGTLRPDMALVLDSDDYSIIVAQKGLMHLKVKIGGRKAHGAYPHLGLNAIDLSAGILGDIKRHAFKGARHRYLRPPTVNIGTIHGGDKVNVVADWCEFEVDVRFLPGMSARDILKDLKDIIRRHARHFTVEVRGIQQPYAIDAGHPLCACLKAAMRRHGIRPHVCGSEGATVITFFQHYNIPAVATGFGTDGCAHKADEYVKVKNLHKGALALEQFLRDFAFED